MARLTTLGSRVKPAASRMAVTTTHDGQQKERPRQSSTQRGYGYKWQQARVGYFKRHPLCVHCENSGMVAIATDLDHIIPHKGDMEAFWDRSNWQGLCAPCHSRKTAAEDGGFGNTV